MHIPDWPLVSPGAQMQVAISEYIGENPLRDPTNNWTVFQLEGPPTPQ